jgi:hypothetical protein
MRRINTRADLIDLARELGVRSDWHEPDEQDLTATTHGVSFDNAGFWGRPYISSDDDKHEYTEQYVVLHKDGEPVAAVNLATLFAWATGLED